MKNKLTTLALGVITMGAVFISSCQKEENVQSTSEKVTIGNTDNSCVDLLAGQTIVSGEVCFEDYDSNNDGYPDVLKVCYNTTGGWELTEVHFFIGSSVNEIPMTNSGNPIPGQFPYKSGNITGETSYCFEIPFSAFGMTCPSSGTHFTVAAHAAVRKLLPGGGYQTETGWGAGERIKKKGNWGTFFDIKICCDNTCTEPTDCEETAFAYDPSNATCFDQFSEFINNPERWGWSNGSYGQGTYTMELWGGAGQCDLSKGALVGSLTLNYSGSTATVTYNTIPPYSLAEAHLYVGNNPLATTQNGANAGQFTIAPGQFPYGNGSLPDGTTSKTYTINGLSGNIYVVAHSVVAGFACPLTEIE